MKEGKKKEQKKNKKEGKGQKKESVGYGYFKKYLTSI